MTILWHFVYETEVPNVVPSVVDERVAVFLHHHRTRC